jgi:hypothetical protein
MTTKKHDPIKRHKEYVKYRDKQLAASAKYRELHPTGPEWATEKWRNKHRKEYNAYHKKMQRKYRALVKAVEENKQLKSEYKSAIRQLEKMMEDKVDVYDKTLDKLSRPGVG